MRLEIESTIAAPLVIEDAGLNDHAHVDMAEIKSALNQGIKAAQAGHRAQARSLLLRVTELDPGNESAWLWLASISEYPEELLGFLTQVLDINSENQRAIEWKAATLALLSKTFVQRGIDACNESKKDFAAECFETALEHDANNATAWMWMASLSDSNTEKVTLLGRALHLEPENAAALAALTDAKEKILKDRLMEAKTAAVSGNNAAAITVLDSLLEVSPDSIEAWMMRSHLVEGFDEKIRCFESILALDPYDLAANTARDSLLTIFGTTEAAKAESAKEVELTEPSTNFVEAPYAESDTEIGSPEPFTHIVEPSYAENETEVVSPEPHTNFVEEVFETPIDKSPTQDLEIPADVMHLFSTEGNGDQDPPEYNETHPEQIDDTYEMETVAEPIGSDVTEAPQSPPDLEPVANFEGSADHFAQADNNGSMASHAEPAADTTSFAYDTASSEFTPNESYELAEEPSNPSAEYVIPMPGVNFPNVVVSETCSPFDTVVDSTEALHVNAESFECPFCGVSNDAQSFSCHQCMAVLTLSDLELLLANQSADTLTLRHAVEDMERRRAGREFNAEELTILGLGHLNLRNLQLGYSCLSDASKLSPNNVVLSGQVNALLIRLEEIKLQEEAHLKLPKGKSILVVDDSATVRKLIAGKLEKSGHDVICANDGVEAMEKLEDFVPDLILLDINMPRMDGYQVCKNIRSMGKTKDVPVVMISGKDGFFDKVRGRMAGTTGYITKPFGPETLMKAVEIYLSGEVPEMDEV